MPPRKAAAGTAKKTASRRVTAPRSNVFDFDAERKKIARAKKTKNQTYGIHMYGRDWKLKRPNAILTSELLESEELSGMIDYLLAHLVEGEREEFLAALRGDEDLDEEIVIRLADQLTKAVYADLPTSPS